MINPTWLENVETVDLEVMKDFYLKRLETERSKETYEKLGIVVFEAYLRELGE